MGLVLSRGHTAGMVAVSGLSVIGSLTIIIAYSLFSDLRKKSTFEAINYIAISNMLTSIGSLMGNPVDGSPACWIEGIGTNIFTLSSIFWNVVVNYIMYCIVTGKPTEITPIMHLICWGLPVFVTLIPMVNVTYGAPSGLGWCWVVPEYNSPSWALMFWYWANYYFWVWICVIISFLMFIRIYYYSKSNMANTQKVIKKILRKLMYYPPVIIICWGLTTVHDTIYMLNSNLPTSFAGADEYYYFVDILPCTQGFLTTLVFWITMSDMRKKVVHLMIYGSSLPLDKTAVSSDKRGKRSSVVRVSPMAHDKSNNDFALLKQSITSPSNNDHAISILEGGDNIRSKSWKSTNISTPYKI